MLCTPHRSRRLPVSPSGAGHTTGEVEPSRDPHARIGDPDRQRSADLLVAAAGTGHLRLDEVDERLAAVWAATTSGQLSAATAGLLGQVHEARRRSEAAAAERTAARAHLRTYVAVMLLLVALWFAIALAGGGWYPWPVWPALGWGLGVARHVRAAASGAGA